MKSRMIQKALAEKIQKYCTEKVAKEYSRNGTLNNNWNAGEFVVPYGFDHTPENPMHWRKLASIVTPKHVKPLLEAMFENVDEHWAIKNPELAKTIANFPFEPKLVFELGYPTTDNISEW